jgi:hypothetical protein
MQGPVHIMATPNPASSTPSFSTLPVFSTPHPIFHGRLRIMQVDGDGNRFVTVGRVSTARLLGMCGNHG